MTPEQKAEAIEAGQRLRFFVEDERIKRWFAQRRAGLVETMIGADDDETRRTCALEIRAADDLLAALKAQVTKAERLQKEEVNK